MCWPSVSMLYFCNCILQDIMCDLVLSIIVMWFPECNNDRWWTENLYMLYIYCTCLEVTAVTFSTKSDAIHSIEHAHKSSARAID